MISKKVLVKIPILFLSLLFLSTLISCSAPVSPPDPTLPVLTNTPAPTLTPTPTPHSLVVIQSTLSGNLLGVIIQNTDSDGGPLDTLGLGFICLSQNLYIVDESGTRLECVNVTDATEDPNQIAMIFSGASSDHKYQLIRGEDPPIDLFPEQIAP